MSMDGMRIRAGVCLLAALCTTAIPSRLVAAAENQPAPDGANGPKISMQLNFKPSNSAEDQTYVQALSQMSLYYIKGTGFWDRCADVAVTRKETSSVAPYSQFLNGNGVWGDALVLSGCGTEKLFRFGLTMQDGKIGHSIVLIPPGTTKSFTLSISENARVAAATAARGKLAPCPDAVTTDTKLIKTAGGGTSDNTKPWRETWEMTGCGKAVNIPLLFKPKGASFDIVAEQAR